MNTSSAKSKGRRYQQEIASLVSSITGIPWGKDELIDSRPGSNNGVDLILIGEARRKFPWSVECKNQEKWNIPGWVRQASSNCMPNTEWLLFFKKNRFPGLAIFKETVFLRLWGSKAHRSRTYNRKTWAIESWVTDERKIGGNWVLHLHKSGEESLVCMDQSYFFEVFRTLIFQIHFS